MSEHTWDESKYVTIWNRFPNRQYRYCGDCAVKQFRDRTVVGVSEWNEWRYWDSGERILVVGDCDLVQIENILKE